MKPGAPAVGGEGASASRRQRVLGLLARELAEGGPTGPDAFLIDLVRELDLPAELGELLVLRERVLRCRQLRQGRDAWVSLLGWGIARLLMAMCVITGVIVVFGFGAGAVWPMTWGLIGAAGFYLVLQFFLPRRFSREQATVAALEAECLATLRTRLDAAGAPGAAVPQASAPAVVSCDGR